MGNNQARRTHPITRECLAPIQTTLVCHSNGPVKATVSRLFLWGSVVNLAEEVLGLVVFSVSLVPESKDEPMTDKQNTQKARVVNTEPLACSVRGDGGGRREDGRHDTGNCSESASVDLRGLHGHGEGSGALGDTESWTEMNDSK